MPAPVKHTCPDIDAALKRLKDAMRSCKDIDDKTLARDIEWEIDYVMSDLENLRKANAALRDWGDDLEKQLEEKDNEIYELEQKLEEIKPLEDLV
jgi:predicted  nucleic acid-binding Zn-ribbon protein